MSVRGSNSLAFVYVCDFDPLTRNLVIYGKQIDRCLSAALFCALKAIKLVNILCEVGICLWGFLNCIVCDIMQNKRVLAILLTRSFCLYLYSANHEAQLLESVISRLQNLKKVSFSILLHAGGAFHLAPYVNCQLLLLYLFESR